VGIYNKIPFYNIYVILGRIGILFFSFLRYIANRNASSPINVSIEDLLPCPTLGFSLSSQDKQKTSAVKSLVPTLFFAGLFCHFLTNARMFSALP
jgi:hypothetical protein